MSMVLSHSRKTEQFNRVKCSKYHNNEDQQEGSRKICKHHMLSFPFLLFYQRIGDLHMEVMIEYFLHNKIINIYSYYHNNLHIYLWKGGGLCHTLNLIQV